MKINSLIKKIPFPLFALSLTALIVLTCVVSFGQSGDIPTQHVFGRNAAGDVIHY
jgi:hypothetical protein